jgi:hypothetical protein
MTEASGRGTIGAMPASFPHWLSDIGLVFAVEAVLVTGTIALVALLVHCLRLLDKPPWAEPPPPGGPGDGGAGGPDPPQDPPDGDPEPPWWPEFERQFAAWAERRAARSPHRRSHGAATKSNLPGAGPSRRAGLEGPDGHQTVPLHWELGPRPLASAAAGARLDRTTPPSRSRRWSA